MARKTLPSPEEYGRRLAEAKRKSDRVPLILQKLDTLAIGLAEQAENLQKLPFPDVQGAIEGLRDDLQAFDELRGLQGLTDEDRRAIQAIESMQDAILKAINALSDAILAMPKAPPPPKPTDLEPLMREIRGYRLDTATPVPETVESVPLAYEFDSISRDEDGNISSARVIPVTRH